MIQSQEQKRAKSRAEKTPSQVKKEQAWERIPGWAVRRRTMRSDGSLHLVLAAGKVKLDLEIGRRGAETGVLRSPENLTRGEVIASLIKARSEEVRNG